MDRKKLLSMLAGVVLFGLVFSIVELPMVSKPATGQNCKQDMFFYTCLDEYLGNNQVQNVGHGNEFNIITSGNITATTVNARKIRLSGQDINETFVNANGDTMSGNLNMGGYSIYNAKGISPTSDNSYDLGSYSTGNYWRNVNLKSNISDGTYNTTAHQINTAYKMATNGTLHKNGSSVTYPSADIASIKQSGKSLNQTFNMNHTDTAPGYEYHTCAAGTSGDDILCKYTNTSVTTMTTGGGFPTYEADISDIRLKSGGGALLGTTLRGFQRNVILDGKLSTTYFLTLESIGYNVYAKNAYFVPGSGFVGLISNKLYLDNSTLGNVRLADRSVTVGDKSAITGTMALDYVTISISGDSNITADVSVNKVALNNYYPSSKFSKDIRVDDYQVSSQTNRSQYAEYHDILGGKLGNWSHFTLRGDDLLRNVFVGKTYTTGGSTQGELKPDLVTNGDFGSDSDWTKGTGWTITASTARHAAGTASSIEQPIQTYSGRLYYVYVHVTTWTAGKLWLEMGGRKFLLPQDNTYGTSIAFYAEAYDTSNVKITADADTVAYVNTIAVREVGESRLAMGTSPVTFWSNDTRIQSTANGSLNIQGVNNITLTTPVTHVLGNLNITGNINVTGCVHYNGGTLGTCV